MFKNLKHEWQGYPLKKVSRYGYLEKKLMWCKWAILQWQKCKLGDKFWIAKVLGGSYLDIHVYNESWPKTCKDGQYLRHDMETFGPIQAPTNHMQRYIELSQLWLLDQNHIE